MAGVWQGPIFKVLRRKLSVRSAESICMVPMEAPARSQWRLLHGPNGDSCIEVRGMRRDMTQNLFGISECERALGDHRKHVSGSVPISNTGKYARVLIQPQGVPQSQFGTRWDSLGACTRSSLTIMADVERKCRQYAAQTTLLAMHVNHCQSTRYCSTPSSKPASLTNS